MSRRVLVTRPGANAERTAAALRALGTEPLVAPLLRIEETIEAPPAGIFDAAIATSVHAVPALARLASLRALPVYAVGERTAEVLRGAGFTDVRVGEGFAVDLARRIRSELKRGAHLLHAAGRDRKEDPARSLREVGLGVTIWTTYQAVAVELLPAAAAEALDRGLLDDVLHYSPRSAAIALRLAREAGREAPFLALRHLCISEAAAAVLREAGATRIGVAERPDERSLLALVADSGETGDPRAEAPHDDRKVASQEPPQPPLASYGTNPVTGISSTTDPSEFLASAPRTDLDDAVASPPRKNDPKRRGRGPEREPPTIDMKPLASSLGPVDGAKPAEGGATGLSQTGFATADRAPQAGGPWKTATETPPAAAAEPEPVRAPEPAPDPGPTARAEPASPPPPRAPSSGFGAASLAAAGLIGGLFGAGLVTFAQSWWDRPAERIEARLAEVEGAVSRLPRGEALSGLDKRIAALDGEQKSVATALREARSLAERAAARAEEAMARPIPTPTAAPAPAEPAAPAPPPPPAPAAPPDERGGQALAQVEEIRALLEQQARRIGALEEQAKSGAEATASLAGMLKTVEGAREETSARNAAIDQRLNQLAERIASAPDPRTGLRAVAAQRIVDALRDGTPYPEALAALQRLEAEGGALSALEPFAASGAPTASALAREFAPLGERIVASARTAAGDDWAERLRRMFGNVVAVRAVGDPSATDVPGLVARIDSALARGAIAEAASAFDALPEPSRRLAESFGTKLKARVAADAAAQRLAGEALKAVEATAR